MNEQHYQTLMSWSNKNEFRCKLITSLCRLLPCTLFFFYSVGSLCLFSHFLYDGFRPVLLLFWLIPAIGLILISLIRKYVCAARPYDLFDFTPLIHHESGSSFPSRHTASAFFIFFALLWLSSQNIFPIALSCLAGLCAVLTALSRIIAGLHFPKDVFAGILFASLFSLIGFSIF